MGKKQLTYNPCSDQHLILVAINLSTEKGRCAIIKITFDVRVEPVMLIKFAPASVASALARRVFRFQEDQRVIFLCRADKSFFKFITHNKREQNDLVALRMRTRNKDHYPQQVSMREKLRPSHWKNHKFLKCLLNIFKSTYVIKLYTNFTRSYNR
jgi:hypothetical protein